MRKSLSNKISFEKGNAFDLLKSRKKEKNSFFFIDPPYTKAGKRLYTHFEIDHDKLFHSSSQLEGKFMMTYDDTPEIRMLAKKYNIKYKTLPMKTTHHIQKHELILSDNFDWWD